MTSLRWPGGARDEDGYLASVGDLMVGLLFIFIIILMAFALDFRSAQRVADVEQARTLEQQRDLALEHARLMLERDRLAEERDRLAAERDALIVERDRLDAARAELERLVAALGQREATRTRLLRALELELARRDVSVSLEPENGVLRLPEELLFDSGEAVLRPGAASALSVLAAALARALPCYADPAGAPGCPPAATPILETLLVEGHTDDVPLRAADFRDNWDLGAQRAVNTFRALTEAAPSLATLRNARGEPLLGVASYEARRPIVAGSDEASRRRNRRIDLRFVVAAPRLPELETILGGASTAP
jgi:chemotaxis protein MotB